MLARLVRRRRRSEVDMGGKETLEWQLGLTVQFLVCDKEV